MTTGYTRQVEERVGNLKRPQTIFQINNFEHEWSSLTVVVGIFTGI